LKTKTTCKGYKKSKQPGLWIKARLIFSSITI